MGGRLGRRTKGAEVVQGTGRYSWMKSGGVMGMVGKSDWDLERKGGLYIGTTILQEEHVMFA